jgi:flagellar motor protein MotB
MVNCRISASAWHELPGFRALISEGSQTEDASHEGETLMKRISAIALFTIATLAASTGLFAQQAAVKANIPFNFTVGEQSMPAGEYTITSPNRHIIQIQSANHQYAGMVIGSESSHERAAGPALVFDKYGEYYFLHRVLSPKNTSLNQDVALGNVEKRVRTREAKLGTEEQILVAAR